MPGEPLSCIWQTAYALSPDSPVIQKDNLKRIFLLLDATIQYMTFSETFFNTTIEDGVSLKECRDFIFIHLKDLGSPQKLVEEEIEKGCWAICKVLYDQCVEETTLFQLWTIANRLIDETSYPPVMSQKHALWISEKIVANLGRPMFVESIGFPEEGVTFKDFVRLLNKKLFHRVDAGMLSQSVQSLHDWLVKEVISSGWMSLRMRSQSNWTSWKKYWCILTPGKLQYGGKPDSKNQQQNDIYLTKTSKVEATGGYSSIIYKFRYTFKLSIPPVYQCEFAVENEASKSSWLTCFREIVETTKEGTTPIRKVLNQANNEDESKQESHSKLERSYYKSVMKHKTSRKEEKENSRPTEEEIKPTSILRREHSPSPAKLEVPKRHDFVKEEKEKIKAVFMKLDQDGNGLLDKEEFAQAAQDFGLAMEEKEINLIFQTIDKDRNDRIAFDEFFDYFFTSVLDESKADSSISAMRRAFLAADRDGTGTLNFKEFAEAVWERRRSVRMSSLFDVFEKMKEKDSNEIRFDSFKDTLRKEDMGVSFEDDLDDVEELDPISGLEKQLKQTFEDAETEDLAVYIRQRWNKFASFRRAGASGSVVMIGGHGMVDDLVPGEYNLIDLALFSDLPPLIPKHTVVKGVKWISSPVLNVSGKALFPADFDGNVVTEFATSERLRYYGCSFADDKQEKISLLYRHGIQDFTYENKYLSEYVTKTNGGAGIEKHDFSHLDCPLDENSGHFILGKYEGDELHLTAFKVPVRHTIYIPGGCIHSNDYLKGTWRTMLSDEAAIDHVHLIRRQSGDGNSTSDKHFQFNFVEQ